MRTRPIIVILVFLLVVAIWLTSLLLLVDRPDRGTFGDMFGAVNALFSGLAFAALVFTILLQQEEIRLQREEMARSREELKRSAKAQEKAARLLALSTLLSEQKASLSITASNLNENREASGAFLEMLKSEHQDVANKVSSLISEIESLLRNSD